MAMFKKLFLSSGIYITVELTTLSFVIIGTSYFHYSFITRYLGEILVTFMGAGLLIGFLTFIASLKIDSENPYFKKTSFLIITGLVVPFVFFFYMLTQAH